MEDILVTVVRAKNGDSEAFAEIAHKYEPLMTSVVEKYKFIAECSGVEPDDLKQEATIALLSAVQTYNGEKSGITFGLYAKVCIRNRIISVLRKLQNRVPDGAAESEVRTPEGAVIEKEDYEVLVGLINASLTVYEKAVLKLFVLDKSYSEIATLLKRTPKSVDNAIYRIKTKLRKQIKDN